MDFNSLLNGLLAEDNNTSLKSARTPFNNLIIWAILLLIFLCCSCNGEGRNQCCCCEKCRCRRKCCNRERCSCGSGNNGGLCDNNFIFIIAIAILICCSCKEDRGRSANSLVNLDDNSLVTVDEE